MILLGLLLAPAIAGLLALLCRRSANLAKSVALGGVLVAIALLFIGQQALDTAQQAFWLMQWQVPWIPSWGISFHLGLDGLGFLMAALTLFVGLIALLAASPQEYSSGLFAALSWAIAGMVGLFLSADIFLFFIFWELSLLPVYFILIAYGHKAGFQAPLRFILYTQLSGLVLLVSVVGLAMAHHQSRGILTFDYQQLISGPLSSDVQLYLLSAFLLAFLIKLPAFPFHAWLKGVFMEMPSPALLVGILIKAAVFGLLRFSWQLFPDACALLAMPMMLLGAFGLIYGAILAFSQDEPKMVLAYATLSHVGMLLIGVFGHSRSSYFGVVLLMICQALSSGGLMLLLDRIGPAGLHGGLWDRQTRYSAFLLAFVMASIGLPGFGNFIGEWLILNGTFAVSAPLCALASLGIILGALYSLRLFQKLAWQKAGASTVAPDLLSAEIFTYGLLMIALIGFGLFPSIILDAVTFSNLTADLLGATP